MDLNLFLCLIVLFVSPYIVFSSPRLCESFGRKVCCNGYIWNEAQNSCTRCRGGFYGRNCTIPCPYPTFGWNCQLKCICSSEDCHHTYGCKRTPPECAPGKYGEYYELSCRYPNYRNICQLFCLCDEAFCDPSIGCAEDYLSLQSIEISTIPASASKATTEAAPKSTNILHMNSMRAQETEAVNESYLTPLIAGIISLLIVAGMLLILYVMTYSHKDTCIVQGNTSSKSTP